MIRNNYYEINSKYNKKIALFSDIHFSIKYNYQLFLDIINNLKKNKPDYICIPGDIIDNNSVLKKETLKNRLYRFIEELSLISKVIISIGNHEKLYNDSHKEYKETHDIEFFNKLNNINNVYVLDNENKIFENINFIGFNLSTNYFKSKEDIDMLIEEFNNISNKIDNDKYNILLCHSPIRIMEDKVFSKTNIKDIDLILSGHMHNGLVFSVFNKMKGTRGFIDPYHKIFPKLARGTLKKGKTSIVVTGGIIKLAHSTKLDKFNKIFSTDIDYINI